MKMGKMALVSVGLTVLSGCSTMFNSGSQSMMLVPSNDEAKVRVLVSGPSGSYKTQLPAMIVQSPSSFTAVTVRVDDDCYDHMETRVGKSVTPSYWANILNIYGFAIDFFTGAMWKYDTTTAVMLNRKTEC